MSLPLAIASRDAARIAQREERYIDAVRGWSLAVAFFDAAVMEALVPARTTQLVRQREHAATMLALTRAVVDMRERLAL
jgi:hypothetical protein